MVVTCKISIQTACRSIYVLCFRISAIQLLQLQCTNQAGKAANILWQKLAVVSTGLLSCTSEALATAGYRNRQVTIGQFQCWKVGCTAVWKQNVKSSLWYRSTSLFKLASHFRWWDGGRRGQERERVCVWERDRVGVWVYVRLRGRERTKICFLQIRMAQFKKTIRCFACWHIFNNAGTFSMWNLFSTSSGKMLIELLLQKVGSFVLCSWKFPCPVKHTGNKAHHVTNLISNWYPAAETAFHASYQASALQQEGPAEDSQHRMH